MCRFRFVFVLQKKKCHTPFILIAQKVGNQIFCTVASVCEIMYLIARERFWLYYDFEHQRWMALV